MGIDSSFAESSDESNPLMEDTTNQFCYLELQLGRGISHMSCGDSKPEAYAEETVEVFLLPSK